MTHAASSRIAPLSASEMVAINGGAEPSKTTSFANDVAYWVGNAAAFYWGVAQGFFGG